MQKLFNKILVPVNFSASSAKLVQKAVDIAFQYDCSIHLLHIVQPAFSLLLSNDDHMPSAMIDNKNEIEFEMEKYVSLIYSRQDNIDNINKPTYSILKGTLNEAVLGCITEQDIDLVLIGRNTRITKSKMKIDPDRIAAKTNIPVMTIPLKRDVNHLNSIVIPVTDFLPVRKLIYGIYMASTDNATLKLVGIENKKTRNIVGHYLKKAYGLIKNNCDISVHLLRVSGENVAGAVNEYTSNHSTDLVIVNPRIQTRMPGFFSSFFGNILQKYSSQPVLTINPA